jgi:hypothetical protein
MQFAASKRVMTVGWDESTKFLNSVFAIYCQLEMFDGSITEVCLRGLTVLPEGGTSAAILAHIELNIFAYSRQILIYWKEEYEKENGPGSWVAAELPDPENIGLHRLCEDTVLQTDTCHGARCTKRMCARRPEPSCGRVPSYLCMSPSVHVRSPRGRLAEAVMIAIKAKVGTEVWEAMTDAQRDAKYKVYNKGDCWNHLRNIVIGAMATVPLAAARTQLLAIVGRPRLRPARRQTHRQPRACLQVGDEYVKAKLEEDGSLAEFSSFERIEIEGSSLIRSTYKYFNEYAEYRFGRQIEFKVWRVKNHQSALFIPFGRALGNRQDLKFDGCVASASRSSGTASSRPSVALHCKRESLVPRA